MAASFLLIDDEDLVSVAFAEYLRRAGYVVEAVTELEAARRKLVERVFDTIWLDLQTTGATTGECIAFLEEIRRSFTVPRIIAVSAFGSSELERTARAAGADCYSTKPFDFAAMTASLLSCDHAAGGVS